MEYILFFLALVIIILGVVIYLELEKVLDNTFEVGRFLNRQEKREIRFAKNLEKYVAMRKGKK